MFIPRRLPCPHPCADRRYRRPIDTRTFVLDTSVLLADPAALQKFDEHDVVVPLVVLMELEAKRLHPELGWSAREALRYLEQLRIEHGTLTDPITVNELGGTVRVELNHVDTSSLPLAFSGSENDHRVLAVGRNLADKGLDVTLVSKDLPLRLKASVAGLGAEEYRNELADVAEGWTGLVEVDVHAEVVDTLYRDRVVDVADVSHGAGSLGTGSLGAGALGSGRPFDVPSNAGLVLRSTSGSALARVRADGRAHLVDGDRHLFEVRGRSAEQRIALDLLGDDSVGIVSLGGPAGTGKSVLALAAALDAVLERGAQRRIMVFRPLYAVGGQDLGFLPGDAEEKMNPWAAAVHDALDSIAGPEVIEEVIERQLLEVLPLTHIRGRTLSDTFVILDEAQNLERMVLLTALTRLGAGSRVVLTHDVAQRDNLHVGQYDGVASVVAKLRGEALFGHVTLSRSERSPVAALVSEVLGS